MILACAAVMLIGPLALYRRIEYGFERYHSRGRELLPTSGVNRWGFNLNPLLVDRDDLVVPKTPRKDDIPALVNPAFGSVDEAGFEPEGHVIGVTLHGQSRAWPIPVLNWHCVVNDTLAGEPLLIVYSSMAGMATVCSRRAGGEALEFGISGLVYQCNLVLFDRRRDPNAESLWSMSRLRAISGPAAAAGRVLEPIDCDVLPLKEWMRLHPDSTVMTRYTNYEMGYEPAFLYAPPNPGEDAGLFDLPPSPAKERLKASRPDLAWCSPVVVVIGPKSSRRGYPFADVFAAAGGLKDEIDGVPFRLFRSGGDVPGVRMETTSPLRRVYMDWSLWTALD